MSASFGSGATTRILPLSWDVYKMDAYFGFRIRQTEESDVKGSSFAADVSTLNDRR
jgi:hypothetical protein